MEPKQIKMDVEALKKKAHVAVDALFAEMVKHGPGAHIEVLVDDPKVLHHHVLILVSSPLVPLLLQTIKGLELTQIDTLRMNSILAPKKGGIN